MTVSELLNDYMGELWITSGEDPHRDDIVLKIHASNSDEREWLSEKVLNSKVHLMAAEQSRLKISLFWEGEE